MCFLLKVLLLFFLGQFDIVKLLIENGADISSRIFNSCTPLHTAVLEKHFEITKLLLQNGADVHAKLIDSKNLDNTPLHAACWAQADGQKEIVEILIEFGANVNAEDGFNWTALHLAAKNGFDLVVKVLLTKGIFFLNPMLYPRISK